MRSGDWTVLMIAADAGRVEVVELLLQSGANAELVNEDGNTALDLARKRLHSGVDPMNFTYGSPRAVDQAAIKRIIQVLEARYL
jgi:ankyrin repeat protein